jgi:hypothetical protein
MIRQRQWIPVAGLLATMAVAVYMVVRLSAQTPVVVGDFTNATSAEVLDAQAQVMLRGQFAVPNDEADEDDDDVERKAELKPAGADTDAAGEAEVEFAKDSPETQEVEFSIRNVQPGASYTFVIDGQEVAKATANDKGVAEVELEVKRAQ